MCGRFAMPIGMRASSTVMATPNSAKASTKTPIGASDPWSTTVPAQSKTTAFRCRSAVIARSSIEKVGIVSSAIAKEVLAPVPLVIITSRTASDGRSMNIGRSGAEA